MRKMFLITNLRAEFVIKFINTLKALGSPDFDSVLKQEIQCLDHTELPLQQALQQSSYVSDSDISVMINKITETQQLIRVETGIIYAGVIAGSCCSDDPTPICEQTEFCDVLFEINKNSAETKISLIDK